MARDKEGLYNYYENVTYGDKSRASEIHGLASEEMIKLRIKSLMEVHSLASKNGDKETASKSEALVYNTDKEVSNGEVMKQEHASGIDSQSNYGDMYLMDKICTEHPDFKGVSFNDDNKMIYNVFDDRIGEVVSLTTEELSKEFIEIGDWMQPLMMMKQKLIKARNNRGNPPPFSIPFATNSIIAKNWQSMIADSDPTLDPNGSSKGYRLQLILQEALDENGVLPENYNLAKESFNPENDTRLYKSISEELYRAFRGTDDESEKVSSQKTEAEELMSRINIKQQV